MSEASPLVVLAVADPETAVLYQALLEMYGFDVAAVTRSRRRRGAREITGACPRAQEPWRPVLW